MVKRCFIIMVLILMSNITSAQTTFAEVSVYPRNVVVGQASKVSIRVYTSTFFTKGVEFDNLQIDGAFLIPYLRNSPSSKTVNGVNYSGVEFYYLVFPYQEGAIEFPSLNLTVFTPKDGDYKGKAKKVKTRSININAESVSRENSEDDWFMLANSISVSETWSKQKDLKTGDVLERKITVTAWGTLSNFIPPIVNDSLSFTSIYPSGTNLNDNRKTENIYGYRVDKIKYLLTESGEFEFPELKFTYFNPRTKKYYSKKLSAKKISVIGNPDLEYAKSVQDSLNMYLINKLEEDKVEELESEELKILGLSFSEFSIFAIILLFILYFIFKYLSKVYASYRLRREAYLKTEASLFKKLEKSCLRKDEREFKENYAAWKLEIGVKKFELLIGNDSELIKILDGINKALYYKEGSVESLYKRFIIRLKVARELFFKPMEGDKFKLNP